jgi:hypothetical protein
VKPPAKLEAMLQRLARKAGNRSMRKKLGADLAARRPGSDAKAIEAVVRRLHEKTRVRLRRGKTGPLE